MSGGGGVGAGEGGSRTAEWKRIWDRGEAQVDGYAACFARQKALNGRLHEYADARDNINQARFDQSELNRSRWEDACKQMLHGDIPDLTELQERDSAASRTFAAHFDIEHSELKEQLKELGTCAEISETAANHEKNLRAVLRELKEGYDTLRADKDKAVSTLLVENDFVQNQLRDKAALLRIKEGETHNLQKKLEELQFTSRHKDDENLRLRAKALAAESKLLIAEGKLDELHSLAKRKDIQKLKDGQPESLKRKCASLPNETCQKRRGGTSEMHFEQDMMVSPEELHGTDYAYEGNRTTASRCREKKRINDSVADYTLPEIELPQKRSKNKLRKVKTQCRPDRVFGMVQIFNQEKKLLVGKMGCESMLHMKSRELDENLSRKLLSLVDTVAGTLCIGGKSIPIRPYVQKITGLPNGPTEIKPDSASHYDGDENMKRLFDELPPSTLRFLTLVASETDDRKFSIMFILAIISFYVAPSTSAINRDYKKYFGPISKCEDMKSLNLCELAVKSLLDGIERYRAGPCETCAGCMDILHVMYIDFMSAQGVQPPVGTPRIKYLTGDHFRLLLSMESAVPNEAKDVKDTAYYDETDEQHH